MNSFLRGGESTITGEAIVLAAGQKLGENEVPGNPEEMFGTATVVSASGVLRDSGVVNSPDGPVGTATVVSAGGALRDSGVVNSPDGPVGTAIVASQGGVLRDGGVVELPDGPLGEATIASSGGVRRASGVVSSPDGPVGVAVVSASGAKLGDVLIDGAATFPLEFPFESVSLISDGDNWWIISLLLPLVVPFLSVANAAGTLSLPPEPVAVVAMSSLGAMSFDQSNSFFKSPTCTVYPHPQRSFLDPRKLCPLNKSLGLFTNCQPVVVSSVPRIDLHGCPSTVPRPVVVVIVSTVKAFAFWCETHVLKKIFVRLEKHLNPTTTVARPPDIFGVSTSSLGRPPRHICFDVHTDMVVGMSE